jgi:hypothetical protein
MILYIGEVSTYKPFFIHENLLRFCKTKSYDTRGYPLSIMGIYVSKGGQELK